MEFTDLKAQYRALKTSVDARIQRVLDHGPVIMGPEVRELEEKLEAYTGARHCITVASGTEALLISMMALGIKPGDEVITTPFTFIATAEMIALLGAKPVFVDAEEDTANIDASQIEAAITPRTRAIIVVHLFGQLVEMDKILAIAGARGLPVIEDAAQAIGARRRVSGKWRTAGELGWCGTLSFYPSKNLGAWGDGGMMLTQDDALAERLRRLRTHGGIKLYHHDEVGTNSRLDTLQAAVLLAKMPFLESWSRLRREKSHWYSERFRRVPQVTAPVEDPLNEHIYHQYTIRVPKRDELMEHLKAHGIGCAVYYPLALHLQPCFAHLGYQPGRLPETERAMAEVVSLPVYPELTEAQQEAVVETVTMFYR